VSKWKMVRLGDVCDVRDGTHDSPKYVDHGYPLVTSKNVANGYIDIKDVNYISKEDYNKIIVRSGVDDGDIIMPMIGTIGNPIVVNKTFDFAIKNVALVKFVGNNVLNKYVFYVLTSNIFKRYIERKNRGGTQKFISLGNIRNFSIPVPPLETQKKIAQTLDTVAELLAMRKQQLAELDTLIKSTFHDMFGEFENIGTKRLIDLIVDGAGLSYGIVQPGDDVGEGIGVLRPVDIIKGKLSLANIKRIPANIEAPYKKTRLTGNEILITVRGTTGDPVLTDERCIGMNVTRGIAVIRQNETLVNKVYLNEYLKSESSQRYIQDNTRGATLKQINLSALRELPISLPLLKLQYQFASIINEIEKQIVLVKKAIDETKYLFDSLMSKYFE
jgi:type I restriction enzyme S subunit